MRLRLGPRLRHGGGPSFDPSQLGSALKLWVKSDKGITQSGGTVSKWADQSGNGNDLLQATPLDQPTYNATGGGGANLPYLSTSGASGLGMQSGAFAVATPFDIFLVANFTTINDYRYLTDGHDFPNTLAILTNASSTHLAIDAGALIGSGALTIPGWSTYWATFNGVSSQLTFQGVQVITGDTGTGANLAGGFTLFNNQQLGGATANAGIGEVVCAHGLTSTQQNQVLSYLQSRWGVS